jgi:hypothetical protein
MPDEQPVSLLLKYDGQPVDVRRALIVLHGLQLRLEIDPPSFHTLLALARGELKGLRPDRRLPNIARRQYDKATPAEHLVGLITMGFVSRKDESVDPLIKRVLLSGFRTVPDGELVGNPFLLQDEKDKETLETVQREIEGKEKYLFRQWMLQQNSHHSR